MRALASRVERLARWLPKGPRPAELLALQEAWCARHGIDPDRALVHLRQGGSVLILRSTETDSDARVLKDWPGPRIVILPPLKEPVDESLEDE